MMAFITAAMAFLAPFVQPVLIPIFTGLMGWLLPSPLQKAAQAPTEVQDAEKKGDAGDPSGLDHP